MLLLCNALLGKPWFLEFMWVLLRIYMNTVAEQEHSVIAVIFLDASSRKQCTIHAAKNGSNLLQTFWCKTFHYKFRVAFWQYKRNLNNIRQEVLILWLISALRQSPVSSLIQCPLLHFNMTVI